MTRFTAFNQRAAVAITGVVGTMACAYVFAVLAMVSLPAAVESGSLLVLVSWIAQTFLQLVLLSVIMVGSSLSASRTEATINDTHAQTTLMFDELRVVLGEMADAQGDLHHLINEMDAVVRATNAQVTPE